MKKISFLLVLLFLIVQAFSQNRTITGKIINDVSDGLPGATVQLKGTTIGIISDVDGNYSISVPAEGGTLVFSYIGFVNQEIVIGDKNVIDVTLLEDMQSVEQVIVVGYGVQKKSLVTGAISKLDAKDISNVKVARIDQALQGKTSGVYVAQSSGAPGSPMSIKIRGNSSNGKNDPLYIVDGIKTSGIDFLSPSDIESIEVLKDAASAAIYGSEGGNGVVIITTKRAEKGSSSINYNYYHGVQSVSNYLEMMSASEYIEYERQSYAHEWPDHTTDRYAKAMAAYDAWDSTAVGTNWMDKIISLAPVNEHNISFASANDKGQMYLSATHFSQDGVIGGDKSNFTRYTFNFNADSDIKEWLTIGSKVTYARSTKNNLNESSEFGGIVSNAIFFDPTVPVYYNDESEIPSNLLANENDPVATAKYNALVRNEEGQVYHLSEITKGETRNPLAQIQNTHNVTTTDKIFGDIHAEIKFNKHLKFNTKIAMDYSLRFNNIFIPKFYYNEELSSINDTSNVTLNNTFQKEYKYTMENYFSYNNSFGDHSISALVGFSYENYEPQYLTVTGYNVPHNSIEFAYIYNTLRELPDYIPQVDGGLGTIDPNDQSGQPQVIRNLSEIQNSYFGRLVYDYKEKYMVQANIRRDGSSLVAPNKRFGIFPSFSLGWNLGREDFFKDNISFINSMKLRFSWGQNGNKQALRQAYLYTSLISLNTFYPDASGKLNTGAVPLNPGNPELGWETSQQSDLGLEMTLLNSKLGLSVDVFDKRTKDQLAINSLVPLYLGYNEKPFVNSGEVQNKGFEMDLSYRQLEKEFKYTVSFNASYIKNEVLAYGTEGTYKNGIKIGVNDNVTRYEAGFPVYYFRGYNALGIFQNQAEIEAYVNSEGKMLQPKAIPGDVKYEDSDGNGKITSDDANNYLGKPMPDWTFGMNLFFEYKGFDVSAFIQGVTGNQIFFAAMRTDRLTYNKPRYYFTEAWNGEGTSNYYPRASAGVGRYSGTSSFNFNWSNINVQDGDYMRLKNVTIGYTLPSDIVSRIGLTKLRLYVTASNVFTLTKYKGSDPEIGQVVTSDPSSYGVDRGIYPSSRVITTGINVSF